MIFVRPGRRFRGQREHDFKVSVGLVEECLKINIIPQDYSYHCGQSRGSMGAKECFEAL